MQVITSAPPTAQPENDVSTSSNVIPPKPKGVRNIQSFYPPGAALQGQQGTAIANLIVRADGSVSDVKIVKSTGSPFLDEATIKAVSTWRYSPATRNGTPIDYPWQVAVDWKMSYVSKITPTMTIDAPADAYPPDALAARQQGSTILAVSLDENGEFVSCKVVTSSGVPSLDDAAKFVAARWHFKTANTNGTPVKGDIKVAVKWSLPAPNAAH